MLVLEGLVASSNDPHCTTGLYAAVTATDGFAGVPDQIKLSVSGCRNEQWTSTDRHRVSVHIDAPQQTELAPERW